MKRILRFFTFLGGIGAVVWLLRDRMVSVTTSREPEVPQFIPEPPRPAPAGGDDLTEINGIGPTYAERLAGQNIETFRALAAADADDLATRIDVPRSRVSNWIQQATVRS